MASVLTSPIQFIIIASNNLILINVGPVNPDHVELKPSSIYNMMIQKRETLKSINDEIVQKKGRLEIDLDRLGATLQPYNQYSPEWLHRKTAGRV